MMSIGRDHMGEMQCHSGERTSTATLNSFDSSSTSYLSVTFRVPSTPVHSPPAPIQLRMDAKWKIKMRATPNFSRNSVSVPKRNPLCRSKVSLGNLRQNHFTPGRARRPGRPQHPSTKSIYRSHPSLTSFHPPLLLRPFRSGAFVWPPSIDIFSPHCRNVSRPAAARPCDQCT